PQQQVGTEIGLVAKEARGGNLWRDTLQVRPCKLGWRRPCRQTASPELTASGSQTMAPADHQNTGNPDRGRPARIGFEETEESATSPLTATDQNTDGKDQCTAEHDLKCGSPEGCFHVAVLNPGNGP